jgi:sugar phosphate isomerase/epimerase
MKIGVSSYSFRKHIAATGISYTDLCNVAKSMGFEGIEFVELENYDKVTDPMVNAKYIKEHCAEIGLDVIAYTVGASFTDEDFEPQFEKLKSQLDLAKAMGAPVLRHDVCYKLPEGMSWEDAIELMAPRIRRVTEYAASLGIKTCTENHGYIFQAPERVEKLIKAVDHENYGWLCDMGNFLCADADPLTSVKIAAPYTFHAHAKDFLYKSAEVKRPKGFFRTAGENHLRGTVLGHGVVPVDKCVKALKEAGYDGWLSIEFEGMEENIPALEAGLEYLRSVIL